MRFCLILTLLMSFLAPFATAQSKLTDQQKEQLKDFKKYIKSKDVGERASQVGFLEHIDGVESAQLILDKGLTDKELRVRARAAWALATKEDPKAVELIIKEGFTSKNAHVREGAVRAVGRMEDEKNEDPIVELIKNEKKPLVLIAAFRALAKTRSIKAMAIVEPFYSHKNVGVICAAAHMTGNTEEAKYSKPVWGLLLHSKREVQSSALFALGQMRSRDAIPFVLDFFAAAKGRHQGDCRDCLMRITGRQFSHNPERWINWWKRVGSGWTVPDEVTANTEDAKKYGLGDETPTFHEIKTRSKHIAFIVDVSASMNNTMRYKVKNRKSSSQKWRTAKRIDLAKEELARIIKTLDKRTYFNIITFETKIQSFKKSPVKAGPGTIAEAVKWIEKLKAYSAPGGSASYTKEGWLRGETNTFAALRYVYGFKTDKISTFTGRLQPIADTVFLLSDGDPSAGYLVSLEEIMDQVERYHPNGQVVIHTIAYELTGVGRQLMSDIARITKGKFVEIGSAR
ncbi:MAG: hypothetical protein ACI97A_004492 [Planctomycetota bacterium]|jgi:hypothetical protein